MKSAISFIALFTALIAPATAEAQTYTYDSLGRVSSVVSANGAKTVYYYDTVDNRTATQTATNGNTTLSAPATTTVIAVTAASNLRSLANTQGYTGSSTASYEFIVPAGTTVMGTAGSGRGIDTGTWPTGVTLSLVVNGNVYGGGGTGGAGGSSSANGQAGVGSNGGNGGDAVYVQAPLAIIINSGGSLEGGGGGGGGGASSVYSSKLAQSGSGCGGGGGFPNGLGGAGGGHGAAGGSGSTSGGGGGGTYCGSPAGGKGGAGGNAAGAGATGVSTSASAGSGGAAGYAIRKNGNTVTFTNNGTVAGTVG